MKSRIWIYLFLITLLISCKDESKPCLASLQIWGTTLDGHDKATYRELVYWIDSFEVKLANGENVPVIPNYTDSSFFLQTQDKLNAVMYFRIKPSLNYDTISIDGHLSSWNDGSCSGTVFILDSTKYNGRIVGTDNFFYYEQ